MWAGSWGPAGQRGVWCGPVPENPRDGGWVKFCAAETCLGRRFLLPNFLSVHKYFERKGKEVYDDELMEFAFIILSCVLSSDCVISDEV